MIDWTYGALPCETVGGQEKNVLLCNPVYLDKIKIGPRAAAGFEIKGQGKVIQISFNSNNKFALLAVGIDNQPTSKVNNGFCLSGLCDTRGIGNIQIQKVKDKYRYTCLIPFIFDKKITVYIMNESKEFIKLTDLHIYYLIPKEVKI